MDASLRSASRRDFWIGSGQHEFHLSGRKRLPASAAFLCVSIHLHFESHTSTGHVTFQITQLLKDRFRLLQLNFSTLQSQTSNSSSSASTLRNLTSPAEIQTTRKQWQPLQLIPTTGKLPLLIRRTLQS